MNKKIYFLLVYIFISITASILIGLNTPMMELIAKIGCLLLLAICYLNNTSKINYYYIIIILLLLISDSLLIFDDEYLGLVILIIVINKVLYILILSKVLIKSNIKAILMYTIFFYVLGGVIFYFVYNALDTFKVSTIFYFILTCFLCAIAFVNVLNKSTKKTTYYIVSMFLINISEIVILISFCIEKSMIYVPVSFLVTYVGRYYLYESMNRLK